MIEAFERTVKAAPDAPAIYHFEEIISFGALDKVGGSFAAVVEGWGIGKGDRVAVALQNDPEFAIVQLGTWKRGAILVPLNPMFKEKEIVYHLADSGSRVWIALDTGYAEQALAAGVERVVAARDLRTQLAAQEPGSSVRLAAGPEYIALLVYTSGTTRPAEGAIILHRNLAFNA